MAAILAREDELKQSVCGLDQKFPFCQHVDKNIYKDPAMNISVFSHLCQHQGPVLLLRHDAVARILANGSAAFIESCAAIGWNSCDSVRSL